MIPDPFIELAVRTKALANGCGCGHPPRFLQKGFAEPPFVLLEAVTKPRKLTLNVLQKKATDQLRKFVVPSRERKQGGQPEKLSWDPSSHSMMETIRFGIQHRHQVTG